MKSQKSWDLQIDLSVLRVLRKIPRHNAEAILKIIKLLPLDPYFGDIKKMKGYAGAWRRRVGNYRIFYKIKTADRIVLVFRIERRTSKTYR